MSQLQVLEEQIQMIQQEMDQYESRYQYYIQEARKAQDKGNELYEQQKELERERKLLEMAEITQEEIKVVMSQLKQLQVVLTSDIVSNISLHICDFDNVGPDSDDMYWKQEEKDKYLRELHIEITRTELKEDGLEFSVNLKTNRAVVKKILKDYIAIEPEEDGNSFYWSKEEYPTTKFMKEVLVAKP